MWGAQDGMEDGFFLLEQYLLIAQELLLIWAKIIPV